MIHQVAHYLDTQGEYTLSVALMELRDRLLVRIQQIAEEAFSAPQA
jgi:hypothetical protein